MEPTCLLIRFRVVGDLDAFDSMCRDAAPRIAATPGLRSKTWLRDPAAGTAGGVYVFADPAAAAAYRDGPIVAKLRSSPLVADVEVRAMPIDAALTTMTAG